jgi:hypothetical protein
MKISSTSWHYKLLSLFQQTDYFYKLRNGGLSNCQYIRHVLYAVIGASFLFMVAVVCLYLVIQTLVLLPLWFIFSPVWLTPGLYLGAGWVAAALAIGTIAIAVAIFFGIAYLVKEYKEKKRNKAFELRRKGIVPEVKPDNIVKAYLKAKNEKICTRVEVI